MSKKSGGEGWCLYPSLPIYRHLALNLLLFSQSHFRPNSLKSLTFFTFRKQKDLVYLKHVQIPFFAIFKYLKGPFSKKIPPPGAVGRGAKRRTHGYLQCRYSPVSATRCAHPGCAHPRVRAPTYNFRKSRKKFFTNSRVGFYIT